MGKHDSPSAGKTPEGKRGGKPKTGRIKVQTAGGAWLWKQIGEMFGSRKGGQS